MMAELVSLSLSLIDVGARDPTAPLTHIVLAGLFGGGAPAHGVARARVGEGRIRRARALAAQSAILTVADGVRAQRTAAAWKALAPG